jgi:phenylpropionate dioxygenase-like ring-hydroxylating dioxygenase large terminal subunit
MLKLNGYWYIAAPAAELGTKPIRQVVEGEILVLFRDSIGKPWALVDRCAHRGMALSEGRVVDDCLECPYHGWRYNGRARLCTVPSCDESTLLPQPKTMRAYPVVESDGHLWVWIGQDAPAAAPFRFPHCGEPGWNTFFMHTRFEAPVDACLENFLDVPHTLLVHPGLFRGKDQRATKVQVRRGQDFVEAEFINEQPMQGIGPRLLFPRGTTMRHTDRFILPSITRVDYTFGDRHAFIITSQCTQRAEFEVGVTTAITWRLPMPAWLARPFLRWYCRRVIQQDVAVLKIQGQQIKLFGPTCLSTSADLLGSHIRGLRQRATEGAAREESAEILTETVLRI